MNYKERTTAPYIRAYFVITTLMYIGMYRHNLSYIHMITLFVFSLVIADSLNWIIDHTLLALKSDQKHR